MPSRYPVIVHDRTDGGFASHPPVAWALTKLRDAWVAGRPALSASTILEVLLLQPTPDGIAPPGHDALNSPESFALEAQLVDDETIRLSATAPDARGYSYALTEAAQLIQYDGVASLRTGLSVVEKPATRVRGIQRSFSSHHEDSPWFHDRAFWTEYLDHLALQRFNRFHLALGMQYNYGAGAESRRASDNYFCFPYPFLVSVPGHAVRVQGITDAERDRNLADLAFIARETRRRGMDFYLGLWNHAYDFGYGSEHWFPILGISRETHAAYSAAGLARILELIPEINGLTFRVHHEGGIHEEGHEHFWSKIFDTVAAAGRPIVVDMHAKGVDDALRRAVARSGVKSMISAKYWAEHMGLPYHQTSIRPSEMVPLTWPGMDRSVTGVTDGERRFTRYGYADFLSEDRSIDVIFRMWPGTQKLLLWGDPAFAAGFGRHASLGGSLGVEYCEPLFFKGRRGSGTPGGRELYERSDLQLGVHDWRKHRYTYLLWGRLSYDPDAAPATWQRFLRAEYGDAAPQLERALAALSRVLPLVTVVHGVSGANNFYWPEMYVDLAVSYWKQMSHYAFDTPAPRTWEGVSPFDPTMFYAVGEYVDDLLAGRETWKYTPIEVATWLDRFVAIGETALADAAGVADESDPQTLRTLIDLRVLVQLGRFFAGKFRSAFTYALFRRTGERTALEEAIHDLEQAHGAYRQISTIVSCVYRDELAFGTGISEHGHWSDRTTAMVEDLHLLKLELEQTSPRDAKRVPLPQPRATRMRFDGRIRAAGCFERGQALTVRFETPAAAAVETVTLHFRHLHQGETFRTTPMALVAGDFTATIPAEYTSTAFPLMFFVVVEQRDEPPVTVPELGDDLSGQPYVVVHSSVWPQGGQSHPVR